MCEDANKASSKYRYGATGGRASLKFVWGFRNRAGLVWSGTLPIFVRSYLRTPMINTVLRSTVCARDNGNFRVGLLLCANTAVAIRGVELRARQQVVGARGSMQYCPKPIIISWADGNANMQRVCVANGAYSKADHANGDGG